MQNEPQPWEIVFAGMDQLGPGSDGCTREALARLPRRDFRRVVDAGCGAGRQTLVLARELGVSIDAIDTHQPFLDRLAERAAAAGLAALVRPRLLSIEALPNAFLDLDLIWSEGAVYNVGFGPAMELFARALRPGGLVAVTECSWRVDDPPSIAREFWDALYPAMGSIDANRTTAESSGFRSLDTFVLPQSAWLEGYYDILLPRATALASHADAGVRAVAADVLREIEVFEQAGDSYGYVFYLLECPGAAS